MFLPLARNEGYSKAMTETSFPTAPSKEALERGDVLAPRSGGRFAFGRMIDRHESRIALLPPGTGQRQIILDNPPWLAVAEMLVRKL